jgi:uncharacterized protein with PIN domain
MIIGEERVCLYCETNLAGPFQPKISLTGTIPPEEPGGEPQDLKIAAHSWLCPGCGLVYWYAEGPELDVLLERVMEDSDIPKPGTSYEQRAQVLRMLRRVKRM